MTTKTLTKAQHKQWTKLQGAIETCHQQAYAVVHPRRDVGMQDCYKLAAPELREAHDTARRALAAFEHALRYRARRSACSPLTRNQHMTQIATMKPLEFQRIRQTAGLAQALQHAVTK